MTVEAGGNALVAIPVADQSGLRVWVVETKKLPSPAEQRMVDSAVSKISQVRLLIFTRWEFSVSALAPSWGNSSYEFEVASPPL